VQVFSDTRVNEQTLSKAKRSEEKLGTWKSPMGMIIELMKYSNMMSLFIVKFAWPIAHDELE
jgi:hypothetical protein